MTHINTSLYKRLAVMAVAVMFLFALSGCSSAKAAEEPQQVEKQTITFNVTAPADAPDSTVLITVTQEGLTQYASYATVNSFAASFDVAPGAWTVQVSKIPQTDAGISIYKEVASFPINVQGPSNNVIALEYTNEYYASIHPELLQAATENTEQQENAATDTTYSYTSTNYAQSNSSATNTSSTTAQNTAGSATDAGSSTAQPDSSATPAPDNASSGGGEQSTPSDQTASGGGTTADTGAATGTGASEGTN